MITAIAIDDEPKAIKIIEHHVSKINNLNLICHFYNAGDAITYLKQNPIDLVFLDINMPHKSGLEFLNELQYQPLVIFTTAYTEFALDSYTYNTVDYLLKPFEFDRFQMAIHKVEDRLESLRQHSDFFFIKDSFKTVKIIFNDILFIKGSGNYLDIVTKNKVYSPRMTFSEIVIKLSGSQFVRVHQSYVVNISAIDKIESNQIFIEENRIPISKKYKDLLFEFLKLES